MDDGPHPPLAGRAVAGDAFGEQQGEHRGGQPGRRASVHARRRWDECEVGDETPEPCLTAEPARQQAAEDYHGSDGRTHGQRAEGGGDAAASGAAQEDRPVVPGDPGGGGSRGETRTPSGGDGRTDCALGHVEAPGEGERREPGNPVQGGSRNRAVVDGPQVDAPNAGEDLRPRDRAGQVGAGHDGNAARSSIPDGHCRRLQNRFGMTAEQRPRRVWLVVGVVALVVLAVGVIVAFLLLRESTTAVDVDEAVGDFRQQQPTAPETTETATVETTAAAVTTSTTAVPAPGSGVPEPGVYTYATTGRESIDALDGRSHRYPDVSTITVTHEECGAVLRWRPLRERWDAMTVCPSERGQELRVDRNHHEFFGISDTREFVCEPGALFFPATTEPGTTWTARCGTDDVDVIRTGTIVGTSEVVIGGTAVTVLDFAVHESISGASTGTAERTVRVIPDSGLIVELQVTVDVRNDSPLGDVHYVERYHLRLTSLVPRR